MKNVMVGMTEKKEENEVEKEKKVYENKAS